MSWSPPGGTKWAPIQKIFRWLNESAYLVSIPFVIILLFGIAVKAYSIAIFGATFVVLLNIGRIVAGVANLAVIPLRDGFNMQEVQETAAPGDRAGRDDCRSWCSRSRSFPGFRAARRSTGSISDAFAQRQSSSKTSRARSTR